MQKIPFLTLDKVREIVKTYPTPWHIYDEKGIRENAKRLNEAFSWNKGFKEENIKRMRLRYGLFFYDRT